MKNTLILLISVLMSCNSSSQEIVKDDCSETEKYRSDFRQKIKEINKAIDYFETFEEIECYKQNNVSPEVRTKVKEDIQYILSLNGFVNRLEHDTSFSNKTVMDFLAKLDSYKVVLRRKDVYNQCKTSLEVYLSQKNPNCNVIFIAKYNVILMIWEIIESIANDIQIYANC